MKVGIYGKKYKEEHGPYLRVLLNKLNALSASIYMYKNYASQTGEAYSTYADSAELAMINPDLLVTMGGDGTILGASTLIKGLQVPILGINLGRLGFLANIEKNKIETAIDHWIEGKYTLDKRTMIQLDSNIPIFEGNDLALNDFTLHKRDTSSMIKVHAYVDDKFLNSYWADGLIVATPTGSTGYSLSCGGPIIFPNCGNFAVTPVAPHNLNVRPIVIPDESKISFNIEGRSENFLCTLDSRHEIIGADHQITIYKSKVSTNLIQLEDTRFMDTIRQKLSWGFDTRNI